jgi:ubiquilin
MQGMQEQMLRNPELMQQMMRSPMMDQLMNDPETMRNMMMSNPQLQAMYAYCCCCWCTAH